MNNDVIKYLNIVGYDGQIEEMELNYELLEEIHILHMKRFAFNNYYVKNNMGYDFLYDIDSIKQRLFNNKGDICIGHNKLFGWVLENLGFNIEYYKARVLLGSSIENAPETHILIGVKLDGKTYICDVGLGTKHKCPIRPLLLSNNYQESFKFKIDNEKYSLITLQYYDISKNTFTDIYCFTLTKLTYIDIQLIIHWVYNSPKSRLKELLLVVIHTEFGKKVILNDKLFVYDQNNVTISDVYDLNHILKNEFYISI